MEHSIVLDITAPSVVARGTILSVCGLDQQPGSSPFVFG